jgi:hypothetical protein
MKPLKISLLTIALAAISTVSFAQEKAKAKPQEPAKAEAATTVKPATSALPVDAQIQPATAVAVPTTAPASESTNQQANSNKKMAKKMVVREPAKKEAVQVDAKQVK